MSLQCSNFVMLLPHWQEAKLRALIEKAVLENTYRAQTRAEKYQKPKMIKEKLIEFELAYLESRLQEQFGVRITFLFFPIFPPSQAFTNSPP